MKHRLSVLALATIVLAACASVGIVTTLPTPTGIAITPPAPDLAPELAAFSGTWEGVWSSSGTFGPQSKLIVERIDSTYARVVYIWGDQPPSKAGWSRNIASVLPGGKIQWGNNFCFVFTMNKNRTSIAGTFENKKCAGLFSTITMKKVGQQ